MNYYQLRFLEALAEEGEHWRYRTYQPCPHCGLKYVSHDSDFVVPDDRVAVADVAVWDPPQHPVYAAAGLLIAEERFARSMLDAGVTGFTLRDASVGMIDRSRASLPSFKWINIKGRCKTNDVWRRVASVCPYCNM